jgi:hypothetical protein
MRKQGFAALATVFMIFFMAATSQAAMTRVILDAWTQNETDVNYRQMQLYIQVFDSLYARGPDFVKSIVVTAPDGITKFSVHRQKDWLHLDNAYWKPLFASDFPDNKIQGGTYKVTVTPNSGTAITESDAVNLSFLPVPTVTSPTDGTTGVIQAPTLAWTAASGATYYRLLLWDNSANEPVYWNYGGVPQLRTDLTSFKIPPGVLKPNRQYRLRIEARAATQDLDKRSRSPWVTFTTGVW